MSDKVQPTIDGAIAPAPPPPPSVLKAMHHSNLNVARLKTCDNGAAREGAKCKTPLSPTPSSILKREAPGEIHRSRERAERTLAKHKMMCLLEWHSTCYASQYDLEKDEVDQWERDQAREPRGDQGILTMPPLEYIEPHYDE